MSVTRNFGRARLSTENGKPTESHSRIRNRNPAHDRPPAWEAVQNYLIKGRGRLAALAHSERWLCISPSSPEELKRIREALFDDHCFHLAAPLSYSHVGLALCQRARRCKRDVEVLCRELDLAISW
ncbi:hypothetical protein C8R44DRAFT_729172 [Mycena epipterygia]|nr:hypothetical protein C8R44DRAFT_729172 [Mycena epipterygia]